MKRLLIVLCAVVLASAVVHGQGWKEEPSPIEFKNTVEFSVGASVDMKGIVKIAGEEVTATAAELNSATNIVPMLVDTNVTVIATNSTATAEKQILHGTVSNKLWMSTAVGPDNWIELN